MVKRLKDEIETNHDELLKWLPIAALSFAAISALGAKYTIIPVVLLLLGTYVIYNRKNAYYKEKQEAMTNGEEFTGYVQSVRKVKDSLSNTPSKDHYHVLEIEYKRGLYYKHFTTPKYNHYLDKYFEENDEVTVYKYKGKMWFQDIYVDESNRRTYANGVVAKKKHIRIDREHTLEELIAHEEAYGDGRRIYDGRTALEVYRQALQAREEREKKESGENEI